LLNPPKNNLFQYVVKFSNIAALILLAVALFFTYNQYERNGTLESFNPLLNLDWTLKLTWTKPIQPAGNLDIYDFDDIRSDDRDQGNTKVSEWKMNKNNTRLHERLTGNYEITEAKISITVFNIIVIIVFIFVVLVIVYFAYRVVSWSRLSRRNNSLDNQVHTMYAAYRDHPASRRPLANAIASARRIGEMGKETAKMLARRARRALRGNPSEDLERPLLNQNRGANRREGLKVNQRV
jgi:lysylphosphatidylglycerol synthetase-like protein (DUF2156 family)